jgi:hypothetical protein
VLRIGADNNFHLLGCARQITVLTGNHTLVVMRFNFLDFAGVRVLFDEMLSQNAIIQQVIPKVT